MDRMEKDLLKKSELRTLVGLVVSTITIMVSLFFGFIKFQDTIVEKVGNNIAAKFSGQINELRSEIKDLKQNTELKDKELDYKIERIEIAVENINNQK